MLLCESLFIPTSVKICVSPEYKQQNLNLGNPVVWRSIFVFQNNMFRLVCSPMKANSLLENGYIFSSSLPGPVLTAFSSSLLTFQSPSPLVPRLNRTVVCRGLDDLTEVHVQRGGNLRRNVAGIVLENNRPRLCPFQRCTPSLISFLILFKNYLTLW